MKIINGSLLLTLIFLISVSMTSGLELSASTGGNEGSSSTMVVYGATVDDYAKEHIGLSPEDGTLSNAFSGSGSLHYGSISKSDGKGNYAQVYREISGKPRTTEWSYDWKTYKTTSSTAGPGVGAWLSLTASNAYSISGGSYSSNREGYNAQVNTNINSNSPTSSLSDYYTQANAYEKDVDAWQISGSASGENIALYAKTSLGKNMADSRVKVDHGFLQNYRSEAQAFPQDEYIDLYAIHGSFDPGNSIGKISGDKIQSEGLTLNQKGFAALYGVTINYGSVEGRFDWGTETTSNGWVIAVPLETPYAWGGIQGDIGISALKISSYSAALDCKGVVSKDWAYYRGVSEYGVLDNDWSEGFGFAEPSEAGNQ
jgi:hypothetical protein